MGLRPDVPQLERVFGKNPVLEAIRAERPIVEILIAEGTQSGSQEILQEAKSQGIPIKIVPKGRVEETARGAVHQGVIAFVKARAYATLEEILSVATAAKQDPLIVAVDGIEDPQNLGAIIRSAHAAGAHGVVLGSRNTSPVTPAAVKASAGASEHIRVAKVSSLPNALLDLKRREVWIGGTDPQEGKAYYDVKLDGPLCLVIGSEERGMGALVRERCDFVVTIPMRGRIDSLNASATAAILLFERVRQMSQKKPAA